MPLAHTLAGLSLLVLIAAPGAVPMPAGPPQPPCGGAPNPAYPPPDRPAIRAWDASELPANWQPPACTGWTERGARMVVALSASFPDRGPIEPLLQRFAAVSSLRGLRYWSVTDKQWRPLIVDSAALASPDRKSRRADFAVDELKSGAALYFLEEDSRSGRVVYRMRLLESAPDRFVLAVDNATPIKFMLLTLFAPGEMQSVYFVERLGPERWGYYALLRAGAHSSGLAAGHAGSYMNRAQALYRHFLGQPTDQGPPAAP